MDRVRIGSLIGENFVDTARRATGLATIEIDALPCVVRDELELVFIEEFTGSGSPRCIDGLLIPRRFPSKERLLEVLREGILEHRRAVEGELAKHGVAAPKWPSMH